MMAWAGVRQSTVVPKGLILINLTTGLSAPTFISCSLCRQRVIPVAVGDPSSRKKALLFGTPVGVLKRWKGTPHPFKSFPVRQKSQFHLLHPYCPTWLNLSVERILIGQKRLRCLPYSGQKQTLIVIQSFQSPACPFPPDHASCDTAETKFNELYVFPAFHIGFNNPHLRIINVLQPIYRHVLPIKSSLLSEVRRQPTGVWLASLGYRVGPRKQHLEFAYKSVHAFP